MPAASASCRVVEVSETESPELSDKKTRSPSITSASSYYFCSIITAGAAFDGVCKAVAGLHHVLRNANDGQVGMLGAQPGDGCSCGRVPDYDQLIAEEVCARIRRRA